MAKTLNGLERRTIEFCVYGDYALFADPTLSVGGEKCSYMVPTYEALKGMAKNLYWHPAMSFIVDEVRVMNPIQMETKMVRVPAYGGGPAQLSYYTFLKDVCYQVRAHYEWNKNRPEFSFDWNTNKHDRILRDATASGGRRDVYLGLRGECQAYVEPCVFGKGKGAYDDQPGVLMFGTMYHGITYADEAIRPEDKGWMTVRFWNPKMENGVIKFIRPEKCTVTKRTHEMGIKEFPIFDLVPDKEGKE